MTSTPQPRRRERHDDRLIHTPPSISTALPVVPYDEKFGDRGILELPMHGKPGWATSVIQNQAKPDSYLATYYETYNFSNLTRCFGRIAAVDAAGQLDYSFGPEGTGYAEVTFTEKGLNALSGIHQLANGDILTWGETSEPPNISALRICIAKLSAQGLPDDQFGDGGILNVHSLLTFETFRIPGSIPCAVAADGSIFALVSGPGRSADYILKIRANGELDTQFQQAGFLQVVLPNGQPALQGLTPTPEGGVLAFGQSWRGAGEDLSLSGLLIKLDSEGNLDALFGQAGITEFTAGESPANHSFWVTNLTIEKQRLLATGFTSTFAGGGPVELSILAVFTLSGRPDQTFNEGQPAIHYAGEYPSIDWWFQAMGQTPGAKTLTVGSHEPASGPEICILARFEENGELDESFVGPARFGTVNGARLFGPSNSCLVQPKDNQVLIVSQSAGRPAVLALKV